MAVGLDGPAKVEISRNAAKFTRLWRERKVDGLVKSPKTPFSVIPVKTGIQEIQEVLDSRLRGSDDLEDFLRSRQS